MAGAPAPAPTKAVRLFIRGRVQGVWYRGWAVDTARALGLRGWVRNRGDGRVEALIAGPAESVERMIDACREGPPGARVTNVEVTPASGEETATPFEQRGTV
ncbi:MAG: acylphosphatase [Proteobacteria bacterium]|nr:acylphosphatase [Pseudomonadota bacterium]MCH8188918.1 acylphosphatase [Pseudomonadota bacterium]